MKILPDERGTTLIETMIAVLIAMIGVFGVGYVVFLATATNKNQGTETTRAVIYAQDKLEKLLSLGSFGLCGQCSNASGNCLSPTPSPVTCTNTATDTTHNWTANFNNCTQTATFMNSSETGKPCNTTGVTDSGWSQGLLQGGLLTYPSSGPSPVFVPVPIANCSTAAATTGAPGYVDFLDVNGQTVTGACSSITGTKINYVREWSVIDLGTNTNPAVLSGAPAAKQVTVAVFSMSAVNTAGGKPIVVLSSIVENPN